MNLFPHQIEALQMVKPHNRCGIFYDMGLGKTYIGSEKLKELKSDYNLVICQKSKVQDWHDHFKEHYPEYNTLIYKNQLLKDIPKPFVIITTYDLVWRRPELRNLNKTYFTLLLDESQYIKNESAKRSYFILHKLDPSNVILLSGTPCSGKYEELYSQCKLLGWNIPKYKFWDEFIITKKIDIGQPFPVEIVIGYKNVDVLKAKLKEYGAIFMKSEEVIELPDQIEQVVKVANTPEYKKFKKDKIVNIQGKNLVGDTSLTEMLYLRQLAGLYNKNKLIALEELMESTNDRLIIFYNFKEEFNIIKKLCEKLDRPISYVNGSGRDLKAYDDNTNSVTLVQYQSGATGLNLQKANKMIYYSLPLSADQWMQSHSRIRRLGQSRSCWYYYLITEKSIEENIYNTLLKRQDFTLDLFKKDSIGNDYYRSIANKEWHDSNEDRKGW